MIRSTPRSLLAVGFALLLTACGGGGGGNSINADGPPTPPPPPPANGTSKANLEVKTFATVATNGGYARVDVVDGGNPDSASTLDSAKRFFLESISEVGGTDYNNNWANMPASGAVAATGFDPYSVGMPPENASQQALIMAANNVYDLFQTTTGRPKVVLVTGLPGFVFNGFTGGDLDSTIPGGDAAGDGGPGLFSNVPNSQVPKLPTMPYTMGDLSGPGSGRGASPSDQHQFIQIVFPYNLDRDSFFNASPLTSGTSFLGDTDTSLPGNIFIEARWIQRPTGDTVNAVDQTVSHEHVSGVAVIGGVTAIPFTSPLGGTLATIDPLLSNVPIGARALINQPNVFTYIAHENPALITPLGTPNTFGSISGNGVLTLPSPTASPGGGRVFGANATVPGAVNDFAAAADQSAAPIGFMSVRFTRLRTAGSTVDDPYFHTFPFDQSKVGADTRAVNGSFNRGAAIEINPTTSIVGIDILDVAKDAINPATYTNLPQPAGNPSPPNMISTRARFRIDFDKEVVPNSVGFSRRHTIQATPAGIVFEYNGNSRPVSSPAAQIVNNGVGSPLAASIYVAVNQPAGVNPATGFLQKVNSPFAKAAFSTIKDDGSSFTPEELSSNGLVPSAQNLLATLPRGIVPCDIYPLNQNNLQSYVVEPHVELPPDTVVTVAVCMPGLGMSFLSRTNRGNQTRSGTAFTTFQGLDPVGLSDGGTSLKTAILGNQTIIKVNAGPMDLQGMLFYGGTTVAGDQNVDGVPNNQLTTGGTNVARTFKVGEDNLFRYVNAPVSPQAMYLAYNNGGAGILDLSGTGYTTNKPGGAQLNTGFKNYLEVARFLPPTLTGKPTKNNYTQDGSLLNNSHVYSFGILGRYTSGGSQGNPSGTESELAIGGPIRTGSETPAPGINEGSSGYETLVFSGMTQNDPSTSTAILTNDVLVGIVRDIQVGEFLDVVFRDKENAFALENRRRTYNTPLQGSLFSNSIADPPVPNPPPLRYPVGLPYTAIRFQQNDLTKKPLLIEGNEVFGMDGFVFFDDGAGNQVIQPQPSNTLVQLNPTFNTSNGGPTDIPPLPRAGFQSTFVTPFSGATITSKYVQTGPMPKTSTSPALVLSAQNLIAPGSAPPTGIVPPVFQSRQQIGNYLFVADGVNRKVHALNSNTMEVIQSLALPDPYGLGLSPDLDRLYVSNEADNTLSIVDADPTKVTFMTELKRIPVGTGPRAVCVSPDNEDVFVLNFLANSISIVSVGSGSVRKTLAQGGLNRPYEMACGMREGFGGPAFQSGTYHAYISNFAGNNVLVYQSGPDGKAGIGFDALIGPVRPNEPPTENKIWREMFEPRGIVFDSNVPLDTLAGTVGCFVAHKDQDGRAVASRIAYVKDALPGSETFNTLAIQAGFGVTIFETIAQYVSSFPTSAAYSVALTDYNRGRFETEDFASYYNLFNAGATPKQVPNLARNTKYPLADNLIPAYTNGPRNEPDRLYLSLGGSGSNGKLIEVFNIANNTHLKTITTPRDVTVMASYYSQ